MKEKVESGLVVNFIIRYILYRVDCFDYFIFLRS